MAVESTLVAQVHAVQEKSAPPVDDAEEEPATAGGGVGGGGDTGRGIVCGQCDWGLKTTELTVNAKKKKKNKKTRKKRQGKNK